MFLFFLAELLFPAIFRITSAFSLACFQNLIGTREDKTLPSCMVGGWRGLQACEIISWA